MMVISQGRSEEMREGSLHRAQGFLTSAVAGSYEAGGDGGSHSNICENWNVNFRRQRRRSLHVSRELQGVSKTKYFDRGFNSPELLSEEHHSGLEGYGRHLSSFEEPKIHNHFHHAMEISGFTMESNDMQSQLDCASRFGADNSLESYGRYLRSSSELGYYRNSNQIEVLPTEKLNINGNHELNSGSLSDYAGLGRYSQHSFESTNFGFSSKQLMEKAKFTNYGGYGGGLF